MIQPMTRPKYDMFKHKLQMKFVCYTILFLFFFQFGISSQTDSLRINFDSKGVAFNDFVDKIEKSGEIKFFYNPQWVDSLYLKDNFRSFLLSDALKLILGPESLFYYIDRRGYVIITKENNIPAILPVELSEIQKRSVSNAMSSKTGTDIHMKYSSEIDKEEYEEIVIGVNNGSKSATVKGYVKDKETGEPIIGATIFIEKTKTGATSDIEGFFIFNAKPGTYILSINAMGMAKIKKKLVLNSDGQIQLNMVKEVVSLNEVVIKENRFSKIKGMQIGMEKLTIKEIKELPLAVGERDILKAALTLPGIQTVGEASAGFNVRGGAADQNLFIINNVPIFNTSHMLGFFSVINSDVVKDFKLYKSNIPVEYGGKISSIFDIRTKQGNNQDFSMQGGISPVSARLLIEGPIVRDQSSYILGIRSTYSNWILKRINNPDVSNSNVYFNDFTLNISHKLNENNLFSVFGYYSIDNYRFATNVTYNYQNMGTSLNWKHIFGKKLFFNTAAVFSNYHLKMNDKHYEEYAYDFVHDVKQHEINQVYTWLPANNHEIKFGFTSILHNINPGYYSPVDSGSGYLNKNFEQEKALETAVFLGDKFDINDKLGLEGGIRYTLYNYLGPKTVYDYQQNEPISEISIIDTTFYGKNKLIKTYHGLDFRIAFRYLINDQNSIKLGYSRINQFQFILSNSTSLAPTDRWKLCDPYAKPIVGDQYNIGYYLSFNKTNYDASAEVYYKKNANIQDFKNGADLLENQNIERDILFGYGRSYGIELMLKKNNGKLTGWINYTYSKSELRFNGNSASETINEGNYYPSNYDKPHSLNLVSNYHVNRRLSVSTNLTYNTGRPYTPPVSIYYLNAHSVISYADRNSDRLPDYFRIDLSLNLEGNFIRNKTAHSFWMFTVYNLTGRKNVYSVFYEPDGRKIKAYKISVFATPVFTLSYNFKFGNYYARD